ncbi:MAG: hypothetical protein EOO59_15905, partial [Hymenobacter sp.]
TPYQLLPAPPPPDEPPLLLLLPEPELLLPELPPHDDDEPPAAELLAGRGRREIVSFTFSSCWQKRQVCTRQPQPSAWVVAAFSTRSRLGARVRCWQAGQISSLLSGLG